MEEKKTCSLFKVTRYLCKQRKRNETHVYCRSVRRAQKHGTVLAIAQNESRYELFLVCQQKKKGSDGTF